MVGYPSDSLASQTTDFCRRRLRQLKFLLIHVLLLKNSKKPVNYSTT